MLAGVGVGVDALVGAGVRKMVGVGTWVGAGVGVGSMPAADASWMRPPSAACAAFGVEVGTGLSETPRGLPLPVTILPSGDSEAPPAARAIK